MIAGGIGITSFMRVIDALEKESSRETWLFYGNQTRQDIAFKEHLEVARGLHLVHVLSDEPEYEGETGFVTRELLEKYLSKPLFEHEFLLCGPPVMINKLETALQQAHVQDEDEEKRSAVCPGGDLRSARFAMLVLLVPQVSLNPISNAQFPLPNSGAGIASFKLIKALLLRVDRGIQLASYRFGVALDWRALMFALRLQVRSFPLQCTAQRCHF